MHGFTRLEDELLDALIRYPFTKRQYKVLLAMIRKIYGFQKSEDDNTAPQLAAMTDLDRANMIRAINELVVVGVLDRRPGQFGQVLWINKEYESWVIQNSTRPVPKRHRMGVLKQNGELCQNDTGAGAKMAPTIENYRKTTTSGYGIAGGSDAGQTCRQGCLGGAGCACLCYPGQRDPQVAPSGADRTGPAL